METKYTAEYILATGVGETEQEMEEEWLYRRFYGDTSFFPVCRVDDELSEDLVTAGLVQLSGRIVEGPSNE